MYLNHKLADQRVRIVSLPSGLTDVENISKIVVKEFEWKDGNGLTLAYLDEDGDFVEFSPSTLPDHVVTSAKALVVARPPACIYDETAFPSYAPVYRAMVDEDSASASASISISVSEPPSEPSLDAAIDNVFQVLINPEAAQSPPPSSA